MSCIDAGHRRIIIDWKTVKFISSERLEDFRKYLEKVDGNLKMSGISKAIYEVFKIMRLNILFQNYPSVDEALRSFETVSDMVKRKWENWRF